MKCFQFLYLFRTLNKIFLAICWLIFRGVLNISFWVSVRSIGRKMFCLWKSYFWYNIFRHWAKMFFPIVEKTLLGLWKQHFMCPEEHFNGYSFLLGKKILCYHSRTLGKLVWSFIESFSARLWKLHALCPYNYFYGKPFSWEKNIFFFIRDFERNFFGHLAENQRWSCEKFILHINSNILMKIEFPWKLSVV